MNIYSEFTCTKGMETESEMDWKGHPIHMYTEKSVVIASEVDWKGESA